MIFRMAIGLCVGVLWIGQLGAQVPGSSGASPAVPEILAGKPGASSSVAISPGSLHGYWAGVGYLDIEKLEQKLAGLKDETARQKLNAQADLFLSMVAVMGFQANGKWESELELTDESGKPVREGLRGTWKIVESRADRFLVEILELKSDKTTETVRKMFQFYDDGHHMATPVETAAELADLNPLIVFERIPAEAVAENSDPTKAPTKDR